MLPELQRGFDIVEQQRTDLQTSLSGLSDALMDAKHGPGAWSARQVVEHLVLSEETVGRPIDAAAVPTEDAMFRVLPRPVRRFLVNAALNAGRTLPLPSADMEPNNNIALPDLWARWAAARSSLRAALDGMGAGERRFFHPVLGPLTAGQMLALGQAHTAYHVRQVDKQAPQPPILEEQMAPQPPILGE